MASGLGTLRGAFSLADASAEFGQTMARVGALSRAGADDMRALRDRAIQAGIATQFSPEQAAEGLAELSVRGFDAQQSMSALGGALDLAAGGNISVALASQSVGAALRVFGMQADQAGYATDRLLRIANLTALQHNELALALGTVSRGASAANQSLEEMLPSIGLVRNTGVEASVASSSVSSALIFMARNSDQIRQRLGVNVTDASGRFRNFLDIVLESSRALRERYTNEAERAAVTSRLFGRFGLTAVTAISQQLTSGVRNAHGEIVRGAEAIAFLREQMQSADGAAAEFRERMLDTFRGQRTLLEGTLQTLKVVLGEAFARAFRPFVAALTNVLNFFIRVFNAVPEPVATAVAGIVMALGGLVAAFGGIGTIGFMIALVIPFLDTLAIAVGAILLATLPVVAAIGALAAGIVAVGLAVRHNIGGIGTWFEESFGRVRLGFQALRDLFSRGGFSKAVSYELRRADNQGLRRFVINVFVLWHRLRKFFEGLKMGFRRAFAAGAPAVRSLVSALRELGHQFGFIGDSVGEGATTPVQQFIQIGLLAGKAIARAVITIIDVVRIMAQVTSGFVRGVRKWLPVLQPLWDALGISINRLVQSFRSLFGVQSNAAASGREGQSVWRDLGYVLSQLVVPAVVYFGALLGATIEVIGGVVRAVTWLVSAFRRGFDYIGTLVNGQRILWHRFKTSVINTFDEIVVRALGLVRMIPGPIRQAMGLGGFEQFAAGREQRQVAAAENARIKAERRRAAMPAPAALPAVAVEQRTAVREAEVMRQMSMVGASTTALREAVGAMRLAASQPINVQIDGETIATAMRGGIRSMTAGEFAPVGVED